MIRQMADATDSPARTKPNAGNGTPGLWGAVSGIPHGLCSRMRLDQPTRAAEEQPIARMEGDAPGKYAATEVGRFLYKCGCRPMGVLRVAGFVREGAASPVRFHRTPEFAREPVTGQLINNAQKTPGMAVNSNKPERWNQDIAKSVDLYNEWFVRFAPQTYKETRAEATEGVMQMMGHTANLAVISAESLAANPAVLPALRMSTCPPLAVDRLAGLAGVSANLVKKMEDGTLPKRMKSDEGSTDLGKISSTISRMADTDIFTWLKHGGRPSKKEVYRAATVVADRLCGAKSNPIIRNAQEKRQLDSIAAWLERIDYVRVPTASSTPKLMRPGTFSFRQNVQVRHQESDKRINMPMDVVVMPRSAKADTMPLLIEAKSAGDFTNVNKRRKEESTKMRQLRYTYGEDAKLVLFLGGYFDTGFLGYVAAEHIDWVWEHRIDDLGELGL